MGIRSSFAVVNTMFFNILQLGFLCTIFILTVTNGSMQEDGDAKEVSKMLPTRPAHSEVVEALFKDYDPHIVPLTGDPYGNKNSSKSNHTVEVAVGLAMVHMDDLSRTGVLSTTTWMRMVWNDFRLQWNEADFGNVKVIRVNPHKLWIPDIEVYNSAETAESNLAHQMLTGPTNALVYPDGEILWIPMVNLKVICHNFSYYDWPQGEQECSIKLGSWTHDGLVLSLSLFNNNEWIDLKDMSPASPWQITEQLNKTLNEKFYPCCPEPYQDLSFRFKMKPQYPIPDPSSTPHLLYQLLVVSILNLCFLIGGGLWALWSQRKRGIVTDDYKMRILQEQISKTST